MQELEVDHPIFNNMYCTIPDEELFVKTRNQNQKQKRSTTKKGEKTKKEIIPFAGKFQNSPATEFNGHLAATFVNQQSKQKNRSQTRRTENTSKPMALLAQFWRKKHLFSENISLVTPSHFTTTTTTGC